ncbi:class I SAM-dependent methyltransferase [Thiomicrorhabdus sp. 6S2-11]|uniref:Class I SAM-dependent methyltransferase n=1 Tax=Thiomicrorhabdus marina TaxID=2818442 RepID=A0ABS3Q342_9GAMM|nr:class I SAM-dependent methyltransferase [Thiomicrorhabdus marina]MBO1926759.1 class I SAM-dependent methyltransferase [Thiomicrorhabdus marina]
MVENAVMFEHSRLDNKQRQRIARRHEDSIQRHGYKPQALFWSSKAIQDIRFQTLLDGIPKQLKSIDGFSLLDVGCGFADLLDYLQQQRLNTDYVGVDLAPAMVTAAKSLHPKSVFHCGDLFDMDFADESFDFVVLSGALNEVVECEQQGAYAKAVIEKMYALCRVGVAFNLLDSRDLWTASRPDLQSFAPQEMVSFCQTFASKVEWRDDYLDNDFTVYLYK